ncbi:MAG: M23 family metallopeptidase [bacterium]|nr:M23 family metallopeptidase [bacterium]
MAGDAVMPSALTPVLMAVTNIDPNSSRASELPTSGDMALVAYSGPDGTQGNAIVTPASDRISVYVVRTGDTLSEIGTMFDVSVNTIVWANNLGSARDIHPGDVLVILPISGVERIVARGDTLASLAKRYNADASEIAEYNGLNAKAVLAIGSTIIIPGGEIVALPAPRSSGTTRVVKGSYQGGSGAVESGYYVNPVPGGRITQGLHGWNGIDIGAARGTPVRAAAGGTVVVARSGGGWNGGYGNYAVVTHGNNTQTLYSHMTHAIVSSGQAVSAGQVIGYVGTTGLATGAHLHFEVRGAANPFRNCPVNSVCAPQ